MIRWCYSFEYFWSSRSVLLHKRIERLEAYLPYFIGFGAPLTFISTLSNNFLLNGSVFGTFFPLFIISSYKVSIFLVGVSCICFCLFRSFDISWLCRCFSLITFICSGFLGKVERIAKTYSSFEHIHTCSSSHWRICKFLLRHGGWTAGCTFVTTLLAGPY